MKITICGSLSFAKEMENLKEQIEKKGHTCFMPLGVKEHLSGQLKKLEGGEHAQRKIKYNLIKRHYDLIRESDAIIVVNEDKNGIKNYIGGNTFLEIGFAHVLGKKIYLLNDIPEITNRVNNF